MMGSQAVCHLWVAARAVSPIPVSRGGVLVSRIGLSPVSCLGVALDGFRLLAGPHARCPWPQGVSFGARPCWLLSLSRRAAVSKAAPGSLSRLLEEAAWGPRPLL